jgi:hypothetical protein
VTAPPTNPGGPCCVSSVNPPPGLSPRSRKARKTCATPHRWSRQPYAQAPGRRGRAGRRVADACRVPDSYFLRPPGRSVGRAVQPVSQSGWCVRRASKILAEPVARDPVVPMVPLCFRLCSRSRSLLSSLGMHAKYLYHQSVT